MIVLKAKLSQRKLIPALSISLRAALSGVRGANGAPAVAAVVSFLRKRKEQHMKRITKITVLALGVVFAASAQSNCKDAKGTLAEFWGGGNDSPGTLTNAGWLNGTTLVIFTSPGFPTPVPTQFSYTGAFTVTTSQGQLKGTRTFVTDVAAGWSMDMTIVDPDASTGIFAGATGVLYTTQIETNTASPPTTYLSEINGRICFAR